MTGLGLVRTLSQVGVGLAGRHGGGGEPTDGWQDKSAASGRVGRLRTVGRQRFCRCALSPDSLRFRETQARSPQIAHRAPGNSMTSDDDLRIRLGRVRDGGRARRAKPFMARHSRPPRRPAGSSGELVTGGDRSPSAGGGRRVFAGRPESRRLGPRRDDQGPCRASQASSGRRSVPHLEYLRRDGVTQDGAPARMFDAGRTTSRPARLCRALHRRPAPFPVHRVARGWADNWPA